MNSIESRRLVLEELDTIEHAISSRLRWDPLLLECDPIVSDRYKLFKQHELKIFRDRYSTLVSTFLALSNAESDSLSSQLSKLADPSTSFINFDKTLSEINSAANESHADDINRLYSPYSSALSFGDGDSEDIKRFTSRKTNREKKKIQKKHTMSAIASNITLEGIFSRRERNGKVLDLMPIFEKHRTADESYIDFLKTLSDGPRGNLAFYTDLTFYLHDFINRSQPLFDHEKFQARIASSFENDKQGPVSDQVVDKDGKVFCGPCDKWFSKITVYTGHLSGKKHKSKMNGDSEQRSVRESSSGSKEYMKHEVRSLLSHLKDIVAATIADAERKATMTDREREMELQETNNDSGDEYTTIDETGQSDDESSELDEYDESENQKNLPIGPDGLPMPLWLYKLQGLHKTYTCQICGNLEYRGRMLYEKHFALAKHYMGLRFLGVQDEFMHLFQGISGIQEAEKLWKDMRREERNKQGAEENAIEVEDLQGNVMSQKDYIELKKQGLL